LQESHWPRDMMALPWTENQEAIFPGPLVTQGTKVRSHHRHDRTAHGRTHAADLPSTPKAQQLIQQPRHRHAALLRVYPAVLTGSRSTRPVSDLRARCPVPLLVQSPLDTNRSVRVETALRGKRLADSLCHGGHWVTLPREAAGHQQAREGRHSQSWPLVLATAQQQRARERNLQGREERHILT
jgi:hypothetical protein